MRLCDAPALSFRRSAQPLQGNEEYDKKDGRERERESKKVRRILYAHVSVTKQYEKGSAGVSLLTACLLLIDHKAFLEDGCVVIVAATGL